MSGPTLDIEVNLTCLHGSTARTDDYRAANAPLDEYPHKLLSRNGINQALWTSYERLLDVGDGPAASIPATFPSRQAVDRVTVNRAAGQFSHLERSAAISIACPRAITGSSPLDVTEAETADAARRIAADQ